MGHGLHIEETLDFGGFRFLVPKRRVFGSGSSGQGEEVDDLDRQTAAAEVRVSHLLALLAKRRILSVGNIVSDAMASDCGYAR